jgi:class 3 adenylate cyclase
VSHVAEREAQLASAREAYDRHRWDDAYEQLAAADTRAPLAAADLERMADAARWSRRYPEMLDGFERAGAAYCAAEDTRGAARVALQLAREHHLRGDDAVAGGWHARATTLLKDDTECGEYAMQQLLVGVTLFSAGDLAAAQSAFAHVIDLAQRTGARDVEAQGRMYQAHVLVSLGDHAAGVALADEAAASAMSGELGVQAAGSIYCSTIFLCRNRGDWRRAQQWTDASLRWCRRESVGGFPGLCRFHRAEVRRFQGALAEAEEEALAAVDELLAASPRNAAWAFHELGEVRRRRGDRAGAADAFRRAAELGYDPQPGLALLRLDEGDVAGARTAIRRVLTDEGGMTREALGLVLPAAVTIELAADDTAAAANAAHELEARAAASESVAFAAAATGARGEIALAEGRLDEAAEELRASWRLWTEIGAPFEVARARELLARAYAAGGSAADAAMELEGAQATFARIGAVRESERITTLLARPVVAHRRLRAFMFTDIVDSTRLVEVLGDEAWEDLLRWHDRTLRAEFDRHRGEEVKHEGDGFFVTFDHSDDAIACAVAIQVALADHRREHGFAPRVRIGVHAAAATAREGDYSGIGVHAAARVAAAAGADEILVTRDVLETSALAGDGRDARALELKGLAEAVEVHTLDWRTQR